MDAESLDIEDHPAMHVGWTLKHMPAVVHKMLELWQPWISGDPGVCNRTILRELSRRRRGSVVWHRRRLLRPSDISAEIFHVEVCNGGGEECQNLRNDKTTDYGNAERLSQIRPSPDTERDWKRTKNGRGHN